MFPALGGKHQAFTLKYKVSCRFLMDALYQIEDVPIYSYFLEFIFHAIKKGNSVKHSFYHECLTSSNAFSTSIDIII